MDVIHGYQTVFPIPLDYCSWYAIDRTKWRIAAIEEVQMVSTGLFTNGWSYTDPLGRIRG
jgi:hypothetical protein